jgi:hypothetical protein
MPDLPHGAPMSSMPPLLQGSLQKLTFEMDFCPQICLQLSLTQTSLLSSQLIMRTNPSPSDVASLLPTISWSTKSSVCLSWLREWWQALWDHSAIKGWLCRDETIHRNLLTRYFQQVCEPWIKCPLVWQEYSSAWPHKELPKYCRHRWHYHCMTRLHQIHHVKCCLRWACDTSYIQW